MQFINKISKYMDETHPLWEHAIAFYDNLNQRDDVIISMAKNAGLWTDVDSYFGRSDVYVGGDSSFVVRQYTSNLIGFLQQSGIYDTPKTDITHVLNSTPQEFASMIKDSNTNIKSDDIEKLWNSRLIIWINISK